MLNSSFYITLHESQQYFTGSLNAQFLKAYRLRGEWEVAIVTCVVHTKTNAVLWAFCDLVDYNNVNGVSTQVLDLIDPSVTKSIKPMYVKLIKKQFSSINIQLKEKPLVDELLSESSSDVTCILHFRKT